MLADWTDLKSLLTGRNLSAQYTVVGTNYWIKAIDGAFELECLLPIDTTLSTDSLDFVTNFKPSGNSGLKSNVVQVLGADSLTITPFGSFSGTTLAANTVSNWDIALPQTMVLKGAELFSPNANLGDWIAVSVIDKNNITGQGGTPDNPTFLGTYAISWFIAPGIWNKVEDVSISESLIEGLFLRLAYTSTSATVAPVAIINFISYVGNA